jgi:ribulose-phosphate 3-epimerase
MSSSVPFWARLPVERLLVDVSLWSADLTRLADEVARIAPYADLFHLDVTDAHFAPGLIFFPDLVAQLRPLTTTPFHVHLMVERPADLALPFAEAGADLITVHVETGSQVGAALDLIRQQGAEAGLAIKLETPLEAAWPYLDRVSIVVMMGTALGIKGVGLADDACPRLEVMRRHLADRGLTERVKIMADGGLREHTVPLLRTAGADAISPGSLIFKSADLPKTLAWLHALPKGDLRR